MSYGWEIARIIFYLLLIIGLIYLLNYFLRKGIFQQKTGQHMQIIEQLYIAPKKSLSLVLVNDRIFLLGVSDESINKLNEWSREEFRVIEKTTDKNFKDYLLKMLGGKDDK